MPDRLTLLNLQEWDAAPIVRTTPLPAGVNLAAGGGQLQLLTGASVPIGNGRLPTAAELNGAPYYHLAVSARATAGAAAGTVPDITVEIGDTTTQTQILAPIVITQSQFDNLLPAGTIFYRIPSSTTQINITNTNTGALAATVIYEFGIPRVPTNTNGERLSLIAQEEWAISPWTHLNPEAGGNNVWPGTPAGGAPIAALASYNLVLPTATQLAGAPWYYLMISGTGNAADATEGTEVLYNGGSVPGDTIAMGAGGGSVFTVYVDPVVFNNNQAAAVLNTQAFVFPRLSADGTTQVTVRNATSNGLSIWYRWVIPVATFNDRA